MKLALLTSLFLGAALSANAGLLGTDITLNYAFESYSSTDLISVGAGTEVECTGGGSGNADICNILRAPNQTIDFDDFTITYNYFRLGDVASFLPGDPNGFDFLNLNLGANIKDVILTTTIAGMDASRLSFTGSSIHLNMSDLLLDCEETFTLTMVTNPEPSSALLAGLGALLLGVPTWIRRRRK